MTQGEAREQATAAIDKTGFAGIPVQDDEPPPPVRLRRRKLPLATLALAIAAAAGAGFFAGVRVEKAQITPAASSARSTAGSAAAGTAGRTGTTGTAGRTGTTDAANVAGTIAVVQGSTVYVTQSDGNTVKVTTSDGTTVTRTVDGTVAELSPGQTVIVRGVRNSDGSYAAQSVTQADAVAGAFGGFGGRGSGGRGGRNPQASPSASPTPAAQGQGSS